MKLPNFIKNAPARHAARIVAIFSSLLAMAGLHGVLSLWSGLAGNMMGFYAYGVIVWVCLVGYHLINKIESAKIEVMKMMFMMAGLQEHQDKH